MEKSLALKLAGAAAMAGSSQAYGQIIQLTLPGNLVAVPFVEQGEYYNVLTGVSTPGFVSGDNFKFEIYTGYYFFTAAKPLGLKDGVAVNYPGGFYDSAVGFGAKVGSDTYSFTKGPGNSSGALTVLAQSYGTPFQQSNTNQILGFQFADGSGNIHNGYLELDSETPTLTNPGGLFFIGGAYNSKIDGTPGGDIFTVPEPSTLSALVLGAAALGGLGLARRRRTALAARE
jgi:hypothetical protein